MNSYKIQINKEEGFTLFVAMVVATILLSIGFSLGNIILKQLILTSSGKESQVAFYAADSGAECALYWDEKNALGNSMIEGYFSTSTDPINVQNDVVCGSAAVARVTKFVSVNQNSATTTFYVDFGKSLDINGKDFNSCAVVTVSKDYPYTHIESRGYNSSFDAADGCNTDDPRTVERGVVVDY